MKNFLNTATADYNYTLRIPCQVSLPEKGQKQQTLHQFDDGRFETVSRSAQSYFEVILTFEVLTQEEAATLLSLWHNILKANGSERTFYWRHPSDGYTYVVRFLSIITRNRKSLSDFEAIEGVIFNVEGYKA